MEEKIHLQGLYGQRQAKKFKDFKTGDKMLCNFGQTQTIVSKRASKTGKTYSARVRDDQSGKYYERKFSANSLWGWISGKKK